LISGLIAALPLGLCAGDGVRLLGLRAAVGLRRRSAGLHLVGLQPLWRRRWGMHGSPIPNSNITTSNQGPTYPVPAPGLLPASTAKALSGLSSSSRYVPVPYYNGRRVLRGYY